eukprot:gene9709-6805_t
MKCIWKHPVKYQIENLGSQHCSLMENELFCGMYAVKPWGHVALIGGTVESYALGIGMRWRESNCLIVEKQSSPSFEQTLMKRCLITKGIVKLLTDLGCCERKIYGVLRPTKGWKIINDDLSEQRSSSFFPGIPSGEPSFHCSQGELLRILRSEFLRYGGSIEWGTSANATFFGNEKKISLRKTYGSSSDLEVVIDTTSSKRKNSCPATVSSLRVTRGVLKNNHQLTSLLFQSTADVVIIMGNSVAAHCWLKSHDHALWSIFQLVSDGSQEAPLKGIFSNLFAASECVHSRVTAVDVPFSDSLKPHENSCVLGDGLVPVDPFEFRGDNALHLIREASAFCKAIYGPKYHRGNIAHILPQFFSTVLAKRRSLHRRDQEDLAHFSNCHFPSVDGSSPKRAFSFVSFYFRFSDIYLPLQMPTPRRREFSSGLCVGCVTVLLFVLLLVAGRASADTEALILDILPLEDKYKEYWQPYRQGFYGFINNIADNALNAVLKTVDGSSFGSADNIPAVISAAVAANPSIVVILGPYSDDALQATLPATKNKFILYGPFTGGSKVRVWSQNVLFTQMTPKGELLILLKYAVTQSLVRRIGFVYTTGVSVGADLYNDALNYLSEVGRPSGFLVAYAEPDSSTFSSTSSAYTTLATEGNGAVLIQGQPGPHLEALLKQLFSDERFKGADVLAGSYQAVAAMNAWKTGTGGVAELLLSSPGLPMTDTTTAVVNFKKILSQYNTNKDGPYTATPNIHTTNYAIGQVMFEGYVTGAALAFSVRQTKYIDNARNYRENVISGFSRYMVDNYITGYYGGDCSSDMALQGAFCFCNEGGQSISLVKYESGKTTATATYETYTNVHTTCGIEGRLPIVTRVYHLDYPNNPVLTAAYDKVKDVLVTAPVGVIPVSTGITNQYKIYTTTGNGEKFNNLGVDVVQGPFDSSTDIGDTTLIWNPIYDKPMINMYTVHEYYITPVYAQSIITWYACMKYKSASLPPCSDPEACTTVNGIIKGAADDQVYYLEEGLVTLGPIFDFEVFVVAIGADDPIADPVDAHTDYLWYLGANVLVGLKLEDCPGLYRYIDAKGTSNMIFVPYRTMSFLFPEIMTSQGASSSASAKIFTDTNIQYIDHFPTQSPLVVESQVALDLLQNSPVSFRGGSIAADPLPITPNGDMSSTKTFPNPINFIFFPRHGTDAFTGRTLTRGRNWGATQVYIYSLKGTGTSNPPMYSSFPDASLFTTYNPVDPDETTTTTTTAIPEQTTPAPKEKKSFHVNERLLIAAILWIVAALLLWALLALVFFVCCTICYVGGGAPKDEEKPMTILYTNVDFGASLWSELPELQEVALEEHERLLRDLVKKYKCYEVTSDGSGFIIASKKAYSAVQLAAELQLVLLLHDWNTNKFDQWYQMMERRLQEENLMTYTPELTPDEYKALWRGLRVRVGISSGMCGIRHHSSTGKYSYYGRTVQTAARTDSMALGGQCLVTESTWDLLTPEEIASIDHTYLGPHLIPGEEQPLSLYALNAIPGRIFGPLRRPLETIKKGMLREEKLSPLAQVYASSLHQCYTKVPPDQRIAELLTAAAEWCAVVPSNKGMSDDQYINLLTNMIGKKMAENEQYGAASDAFGNYLESSAGGGMSTTYEESVSNTMIEMVASNRIEETLGKNYCFTLPISIMSYKEGTTLPLLSILLIYIYIYIYISILILISFVQTFSLGFVFVLIIGMQVIVRVNFMEAKRSVHINVKGKQGWIRLKPIYRSATNYLPGHESGKSIII